MERILEAGKAIYGRSTRPFGIARVRLDDEGSPRDVTIEYLNEAMAATVDAEPADLQGKNIYEIWPDGDRTWLEYYYRAAYFDEAVEFETVNVEYRTFQNVTIFPIAEGYCGYELQEVTSWLEPSHPTMENVSAGIFFYESRTDQLLLTEPARECCGLDTDYLTVREFVDALFSRETAQRVYDAVEGFSGQHDRILCEEQLRNGSWIRLSMSHAGPQTRFATGFVEDITFFKEAEAKSAKRSEII